MGPKKSFIEILDRIWFWLSCARSAAICPSSFLCRISCAENVCTLFVFVLRCFDAIGHQVSTSFPPPSSFPPPRKIKKNFFSNLEILHKKILGSSASFPPLKLFQFFSQDAVTILKDSERHGPVSAAALAPNFWAAPTSCQPLNWCSNSNSRSEKQFVYCFVWEVRPKILALRNQDCQPAAHVSLKNYNFNLCWKFFHRGNIEHPNFEPPPLHLVSKPIFEIWKKTIQLKNIQAGQCSPRRCTVQNNERSQ